MNLFFQMFGLDRGGVAREKRKLVHNLLVILEKHGYGMGLLQDIKTLNAVIARYGYDLDDVLWVVGEFQQQQRRITGNMGKVPASRRDCPSCKRKGSFIRTITSEDEFWTCTGTKNNPGCRYSEYVRER